MTVCPFCGKGFDQDNPLDADADVCPSCRPMARGKARVYCNACKTLVFRVEPGMYGTFPVKAGDVLHVDHCPKDTPGLKHSPVIEQDEWEKRHGC